MKKNTSRKLKAIAEKLGDIQKQIMTEEPIMGWELLLTGYGKQPIAKTIDPNKEYFLKVPTIIYQSTEKELKRSYTKGGVKQVAQVVRGEIAKRKQ